MVRNSLQQLRDLLGVLSESDEALYVMQKVSAGIDVSNPNLFLKLIAFFDILQDLRRARVILRDLRIGLVDFPARHHGQDIFLCWKEDEPSVQYWHPKGAGFRGRRPISDLEEEP
jgi:hypothetical protein